MLAPFFRIAMTAPGRQLSFRRLAALHTVLVTFVVALVLRSGSSDALGQAAAVLLVLGIVEGAAVVGWRLTQLPKSLALEFMLTSPVQPQRMFLAELLVGVCRFAYICLTGVPVLALWAFAGVADWPDLLVLAVMPFVWGVVAGVALTTWVYEPVVVRKLGELLGLVGVLIYLVVGVLAGEHLRAWLEQLPDALGRFLFHAILYLHNMNPFGVVRYWFASDNLGWLAWDRWSDLHLFAAVLLPVLAVRAAVRLRGHFHDRHYKPIDSGRPDQLAQIGERPLSWWAVKRVMEYSGRVNLWLANGFALLYAVFVLAGDAWPAWMGKLVFALFDSWGGVPMLATALVTLAAVPAVYQFGLWDATTQARCMRLELLLLTELSGRDYAHASFAAAARRGRGYSIGAVALWLAYAAAGHVSWWDACGAIVGGAVLWAFAFAIGFRGFTTGHQTNGLASLFTLGLPMVLFALWRIGWYDVAALLPTAVVFVPMKTGLTWPWFAGLVLTVAGTVWMLYQSFHQCEARLRTWYDANQGTKAVE